MLLNMVSENLTEALIQWKDGGVSQPDLAAPTLYRDLLNKVLDSDGLMDSSTEMVQMFQGKYCMLKHYSPCPQNKTQ